MEPPVDAFVAKPAVLYNHDTLQALGDVEIEDRLYSVDIQLIDMNSEPPRREPEAEEVEQ